MLLLELVKELVSSLGFFFYHIDVLLAFRTGQVILTLLPLFSNGLRSAFRCLFSRDLNRWHLLGRTRRRSCKWIWTILDHRELPMVLILIRRRV